MFDADTIAREAVQTVINHLSYIYLRMAWGGATSPETIREVNHWLESSPLIEEVRLLVNVANGSADEHPGEVMETIQSVVELLYSHPGSGDYTIPDHFWTSDLGRVIQHCQLFVRGDDLITHSEAATILYGVAEERELMRLRRLIDRGALTAYTDPREPNPQRAGRVSRAEIERLSADPE